jgi:hypothetical protein
MGHVITTGWPKTKPKLMLYAVNGIGMYTPHPEQSLIGTDLGMNPPVHLYVWQRKQW